MQKNLMYILTRHLLAGATIVASFGAHAQFFAPTTSISSLNRTMRPFLRQFALAILIFNQPSCSG